MIRERHIILGVTAVTLVLIVILLLLPKGRVPQPDLLPWQIALQPSGTTRVFGIELGSTPLGMAVDRFREQPELTLFVARDGSKKLEAFFDQVDLHGLRAKIVLVVEATQEQLEPLLQRGARVATLGSGARKVTLRGADQTLVASWPVAAVTYLPKSNLEPELVTQRFGEPLQRVVGDEGLEHWLYPQLGLEVLLNPDGPEVLQYVQPGRFSEISGPLMRQSASGQ